MTETESKWAARVEQWRASGKSAPEFTQGQGFEPSTLRYWASRLKHPPRARQSEKPAARVRMVRVRRTSHPVAANAVVIAIGVARIEVRSGFDGALLREVVDALTTGPQA